MKHRNHYNAIEIDYTADLQKLRSSANCLKAYNSCCRRIINSVNHVSSKSIAHSKSDFLPNNIPTPHINKSLLSYISNYDPAHSTSNICLLHKPAKHLPVIHPHYATNNKNKANIKYECIHKKETINSVLPNSSTICEVYGRKHRRKVLLWGKTRTRLITNLLYIFTLFAPHALGQ